MNMKGYTFYKIWIWKGILSTKYEYERVYSLESFHEFCNFYNVSRNIWLCLMRQYPGFNVPLYNYTTIQQKYIECDLSINLYVFSSEKNM